MLSLVALLIFVIVVLCGYAASIAMQERTDTRQVLSGRLRTMTGGASMSAPATLLKDQRLSSIPFLDNLLNSIPSVRPMVRMIRQAGLRRRVGEVLLYIPLLASIGFVGTVLAGGGRAIGLVIAVVAGAIPLVVVSRIRRRRAALFAEQLPDGLDLIRSALQAGHGLLSSFAVVAETFPDPISSEFHYLVEEVRLGLPLRDALTNLIERVDDPSLPILTVGILVVQDVGGNLAEVIDNITHTIRERAKLHREIHVLTAQGRLSGTVLTCLPFFVATAMYFISPKYYDPMFEPGIGRYLVAYGITSVLLGHIVIRRLVSIRV